MTTAPIRGQDTEVRLYERPGVGAITGGVWLVFLAPGFAEAFDSGRSSAARIAGFAVLVAFSLLYLLTLTTAWDRADARGRPRNLWDSLPERAQVWRTAGLVGLALIAVLVIGENGVAALVYLAPISASLAPRRLAGPGIAVTVVAIIVAALLANDAGGGELRFLGDFTILLSCTFAAVTAGTIVLGIRRMRSVLWDLETARTDVERLATAGERVRIARDLHDVLGHSLTVISVRSQLAARLTDRGEHARAGEEINAVGQLARDAMTEVRDAVAGYRIRSFAAELTAAETTLEDAGLEVSVERSPDDLPAAAEPALGFLLREGVTNVLRHSSATACTISVRHTAQAVIVELADDGRGCGQALRVIDPTSEPAPEPDANRAKDEAARPAEAPSDITGTGLGGLAARLHEVGGQLTAGDAPDGGFVLRAEVRR